MGSPIRAFGAKINDLGGLDDLEGSLCICTLFQNTCPVVLLFIILVFVSHLHFVNK